jgi:hypothetical protein
VNTARSPGPVGAGPIRRISGITATAKRDSRRRAVIGDIDALQRAVATSMYEQARQRRILAPAEAINVLSIGALHADAATAPASDTVLDTAITGTPAQYSPVGFRHRNSAKPEILLPGGRSLHLRPISAEGDTLLESAATSVTGPGIRVAAPGVGGAGPPTHKARATPTLWRVEQSMASLTPWSRLTRNRANTLFPQGNTTPCWLRRCWFTQRTGEC